MFTLQILDRGQTFLHPVDRGPLVLGSAPTADITLQEEGVAPAHARIEPTPNGARLLALAPTSVNGTLVASADLTLGDRLEIGRAVVVVGRTVMRKGKPDEVLADGVPRERGRRRAARRSWLVPVMAAALLAGVVAWMAGGDSSSRVAAEIAAIQRWRLGGQVERAAARIDTLRREWVEATDGRLQRLDAEAESIAAIAVAAERLRTALSSPDDPRGYAEWSQELQRLEHDGAEDERVAARQVRGRLTELLRERPRPARQPEAGPASAAAAAPVAQAASAPAELSKAGSQPPPAASANAARAPAPPPAPAPTPVATSVVLPTAKIDLREVDRLQGQGLFAQALSLLQASLAEGESEAEVARLREKIDAVHADALEAMAKVLEEAKQEAAHDDPREAAQVLFAARHRFPPTGAFTALSDAQRDYELRASAVAKPNAAAAGTPVARPVDEAVRSATLAALRARMDAVRAAEEKGDFRTIAAALQAAAAEVGERDADFAARLRARAGEAELVAAWHEAVDAAMRAGRHFKITAESRTTEIERLEGALLVGGGGALRLTWHELDGKGVATIVDQLGIEGAATLGAAVLIYRQGEPALAEKILAKLLRADASTKSAIDQVIARGRGEPLDARGYVFGKDGFQSVRSLEVQQQARQLAQRLDAALRDKNPEARQVLLDATLASGPETVPVLVAALQRELTKQIQKLDTGQLKKQIDKLAAQRALLDDARRAAKELIFDEKKYFYPYKPPAVSSDRYAEYLRVQAEVDRRVAAVRTLWQDDRARVRVPSGLRADLDRLDWLATTLGGLGELDHAQLAPLEWTRALPAGDSVGIRDYCTSQVERGEAEEWCHVESYNAVVGKTLSSAQREQLKITNDYRRMFRHRPLAAVTAICAAAQGHAEEMSKLGYFAHFSPTPGRKTPFDRMKLAGYGFGVSENCALADGAQGAHQGWCQSSGHHRNLLDPSHREIGIGADGRYWVQNFGSGAVHRLDPAWASSAATKR